MRRLFVLTAVLLLAGCEQTATGPEMAPDLAPQFVVTGDPTAPDIVEIFDDAVLDGLIDADGAYAVSGGTISKMTEASQIDRSYVGTLARTGPSYSMLFSFL